MLKKRITFLEIVRGVFLSLLSYILIAVFNISNEDLYNWDVALIFSKGDVLDRIALLAFWAWFLIIAIWITTLLIRIFKIYIRKA